MPLPISLTDELAELFSDSDVGVEVVFSGEIGSVRGYFGEPTEDVFAELTENSLMFLGDRALLADVTTSHTFTLDGETYAVRERQTRENAVTTALRVEQTS